MHKALPHRRPPQTRRRTGQQLSNRTGQAVVPADATGTHDPPTRLAPPIVARSSEPHHTRHQHIAGSLDRRQYSHPGNLCHCSFALSDMASDLDYQEIQMFGIVYSYSTAIAPLVSGVHLALSLRLVPTDAR